jgi:hypothetical protein
MGCEIAFPSGFPIAGHLNHWVDVSMDGAEVSAGEL